MSGTLPCGDVHGFYSALGLELPAWAERDASVRCFANPDAHAHRDRHPSCSVSLVSGAWRCWRCDARGGAYDAALASGLSPPEAMDLLVVHGLAERRADRDGHFRARRTTPSPVAPGQHPRSVDKSALAMSEAELAVARERLAAQSWPLSALRAEQRVLWSRAVVVHELGCGWEHGRLLIPIRGRSRVLRGVLRYAPGHDRAPKMLAVAGTRLGLVPHPAAEWSTWVVLVEGPPDMISARSRGLPAIAVPGDHAWGGAVGAAARGAPRVGGDGLRPGPARGGQADRRRPESRWRAREHRRSGARSRGWL